MKKLINKPEDVVVEELQGIALAHPDLVKVHFDPNYVVRADAPVKGKVAVISGGGSGHEPMHGGFVGMGMLDAACPGAVFTSPTPDQMLEATKAVDGGAGVLHIVKNYTGDIMNFEMAAELARAEGIEVEAVVIDDDVAVQDSLYTAGRRGVGTTVLAEKICGAAAEAGASLAEVTALCRKVNGWGRSMGMALTSCTVPAGRQADLRSAGGRDGDRHRHPWRAGTHAHAAEARRRDHRDAGGSGDRGPAVQAGRPGDCLRQRHGRHAAHRAVRRLPQADEICDKHGITIVRNLVGNYITSLEMAGCSITLLKVDDELLTLWDVPVQTPACAGACD